MVDDITGDVKQTAIDTFNDTKESALETLESSVESSIESFVEEIKSKGGISEVQDTLATVQDTVDTAASTYNAAIAAAELTKASALGIEALVIEGLKQAAEAYKNSILNTTGFEINISQSKTDNVLNTINPEAEPGTDEQGLYLKFVGSKVKLNSIEELEDTINTINENLDSQDAATTRAWVHEIVKTHPLVDEKIKDLTYFQDICEETGSTYLLHTKDTQTLQLEDWATELAVPIRNLLSYKLDEDQYNMINNAYYGLNTRMSANISNEYYGDEIVSSTTLGKDETNNDYHIVGDSYFYDNHIGQLEETLMTALVGFIGETGKLINWLVPVSTYESALSGGFTVTIEGNEVSIDLKGNKIGVIATVIDETPITPKEE